MDAHETTSGAAAKLRTAFLSDSCPGRWQPGGKSTPAVLKILRSADLLPSDSETPAMHDIWSAMKTYAQVHPYGSPNGPSFQGEFLVLIIYSIQYGYIMLSY